MTGTLLSQRRYLSYGETRWSSGAFPTDRRCTGQREEVTLGVYDYGARFYSPGLGRFAQADTLVPEAGNPQSLNRYSYVLGNPVRYQDPSGHSPQGPCAMVDSYKIRCGGGQSLPVVFIGEWDFYYKNAMIRGSYQVAKRVQTAERNYVTAKAAAFGENPADLATIPGLWATTPWATFHAVFGQVIYDHVYGDQVCPGIGCWAETHANWSSDDCSSGRICYDEGMFDRARTFNTMQNVTHELGHWIDQLGGRQARKDLATAWDSDPLLARAAGGFAKGSGWQQNLSDYEGEVFADMFLGWTFNRWSRSETNAAAARARYMNINMPSYIALAVSAQE